MKSELRPQLIVSGSTVAVTEAICRYLKPELEGSEKQIDRIKTVERHAMRFDTPEALSRYMTGKNGSIRVAATGVPTLSFERGRGLIGTVALTAFVFTADAYGFSRDTRAEVIAMRLASLIAMPMAAKDMGAESVVKQLEAHNLSSHSLDDKGFGIWAISWLQDWRLDLPLDLSMLDDFNQLCSVSTIADGAPTLDADITLEQNNDNHSD